MPCVSIIVPCYNEELSIGMVLEAIYLQTFPRSEIEVLLCDGISEDGTRDQVDNFCKMHPDLDVRILDNQKRIIPAALNIGINAARGAYIVRLDGHSIPNKDYVERCVNGLKSGLGENIGGIWNIQAGGTSCLARSIAEAAAHPLGVGDARYRFGAITGEVDTVPFGSYQRCLFDQIGLFDESLLTNEDYELNVRIRQNGGKVWMDPDIQTTYIARTSLKELSRQYFRYGFWKARMLVRYPSTLKWRQALPPLFVLGIVTLLLLSPFFQLARISLAGLLALYILVLLLGAFPIALKNRSICQLGGISLAIASMHFTWGSGFLWSLLSLLTRRMHRSA